MLNDKQLTLRREPEAAAPVEDAADLAFALMRAVLRRWIVVLLTAFTTILTAYVAFQAIGDVYEVEARLLVRVGRENLRVPDADQGSLVLTGVRKEDINSDVALLGSQFLIARTVDVLGVDVFTVERPPPVTLAQRVRRAVGDAVREVLEAVETALARLGIVRPVGPREALILALEDRLFIRREGESDVIHVALRFPDPALGVRVLDTLLSQFFEHRALARAEPTSEAVIARQAADYADRLEAVEDEIQRLRTALDLTSIPEERRLLLERGSALDTVLREAASARASAAGIPFADPGTGDAEAMAMAEGLGGAPFRLVSERLGALLIERAALIDDFVPSGRAVTEIERRIASLASLLERSVAAQVASIAEEKTAIGMRLEALSRGALELERLERRQRFLEERLATFAVREDEARYSERLLEQRIANVSILNPPSPPVEPVSPRRLRMAIVSVPVGVALGLTIAAALAFFDRRVYGRRDLARIPGLVVLGEITPGR